MSDVRNEKLTFCLSPSTVQLVPKKKTENKNFPNVNLILSICQLIVYLSNDF
jgi:hypothetical protein